VRSKFVEALRSNQAEFELSLDDRTIDRLADYFELVQKNNPLLHLVGPCSPGEFATRHTLESLTLLKHLPQGARFADVGTGAGLPSIPCLIARDDTRASLIETKIKKAKFLRSALVELGLSTRATVVNRQFEEVDPGDNEIIACRALDKFTEKLSRLIKWAGQRRLALFGGENLALALKRSGIEFSQTLLPLSERRFLFVSRAERYGGHPKISLLH
jgi:16S rRNA (guanine527-N7)-methyltransferase